jgi:epoxide hydrolase 4
MMNSLPRELKSEMVDVGEVTIHVVHNGQTSDLSEDTRPALLMLHGFPEYWAAWKPLVPFLSDKFLMIMPDQRGYNLSSAPQETEAYVTSKLVADMALMMSILLSGKSFHLAGHDWGASVAYALAMSKPESVESLTIINGVHPVLFQRALSFDPAQAAASQYFHKLCADDALENMSANGFAKTFSMLEKFSATDWMTDDDREGYLSAWSEPGRMNAMLNWYRSSPLAVPSDDDPNPRAWILEADPSRFMISMPHLVIWGMDDPALLPVCREGLEEFAPDLKIVEIPGADHWIIHEEPERVARHMSEFSLPEI